MKHLILGHNCTILFNSTSRLEKAMHSLPSASFELLITCVTHNLSRNKMLFRREDIQVLRAQPQILEEIFLLRKLGSLKLRYNRTQILQLPDTVKHTIPLQAIGINILLSISESYSGSCHLNELNS